MAQKITHAWLQNDQIMVSGTIKRGLHHAFTPYLSQADYQPSDSSGWQLLPTDYHFGDEARSSSRLIRASYISWVSEGFDAVEFGGAWQVPLCDTIEDTTEWLASISLLKSESEVLEHAKEWLFLVLMHGNKATIATKFNRLTSVWRRETSGYSLLNRIVDHPAYQEIIEMGEVALPLIFSDLQQEPDYWFTALRKITGANPVPETDRGQLSAMRDHWLRWGRENGYIF